MSESNRLQEKYIGVPQDIVDDMELWLSASRIYYKIDDVIDMDSMLSDFEFDELTVDLKNRCAEIPHLLKILTSTITTENGQLDPTQTVMISLDKIQWETLASMQKVIKWFGGVEKLRNCVVGPKLDGHAIKVVKHNGYIQKVQTRGGKDLTEVLKNHPDIVALLKYDYDTIHGELVLPKKTFNEKWSTTVLGEDDGYANPRNAVSGVLKHNPLDLKFIGCTDGVNPINDFSSIWVNVGAPDGTIIDFFKFYNNYKNDEFPYQIDGIVIGFNVEQQVIKDNFPLNLVSVKFPAPTAKTKVIGFEWSQKKSGNLTPMYILEPVLLDGSMCSRANGYNHDSVKKLHCGKGSEVIITKSNDIIPIIQKVLTRSANIIYPDVEYTIKGKHLVAVNMEISEAYRFVLGLKLLDIEGIGDTLANQIGEIVNNDIIELFNVKYKPDIRLALGGGKVWNKFEQFYDIKTLPIDQLIEIMQFNRVGKVLAGKFGNLITGKKIDTSGIEKSVLLHVCKGEGFQQIKAAMTKLQSYGVKVIKPIEINDSTITFEMTGSPKSGQNKKDFVAEFQRKYPNSSHTTLTKNTTYLFVDDLGSSSSKVNKARKLNIPMLTYEDALIKQLESNTEF